MTDQLSKQLRALHFASLQELEAAWRPAVNVYAYEDRIVVCVDLAGVHRQDITVEVQPRRVVIRGQRKLPDSGCNHPPCGRLLIMEIPDGCFERSIAFPVDIDTGQVEARPENGWLWITLPVIQPGEGA